MPRISLSHRAAAGFRLLLLLLAAGALAAAAPFARAWLGHRALAGQTLPSSEAAAAPESAAPRGAPERLEAERVTLRPNGFEPSEITRPAGRFLLAVNDRSGLDDVSLRLVRGGGGGALHETRFARGGRGRRVWRQVLNLQPGEYALREAGRPEWVCRITVTR